MIGTLPERRPHSVLLPPGKKTPKAGWVWAFRDKGKSLLWSGFSLNRLRLKAEALLRGEKEMRTALADLGVGASARRTERNPPRAEARSY